MRRFTAALVAVSSALAFATGCGDSSESSNTTTTADAGSLAKQSGIPSKTIRFALQPYADHSYESIAIEKGWFKDVGVDLQPKVVDADKVTSVLLSGSVDMGSINPVAFIPLLKRGAFDSFTYSDVFQGYAIMAQPGSPDKTYSDFVSAGQAPEQAVRSTLAQLRGKRFTYPAEPTIKGFIATAFHKGGLSLNDDVKGNVTGDANGVALMLAKRADYEVGGVPSRISLESQGFKPLLTSIDLVKAAGPSPTSEEIRAIVHGAWSTTKKYADANHDTLLRMTSVNLRLMQFMNDRRSEACDIHMKYLNSIAGTDFGQKQCDVIYTSLDPFYSLDKQKAFFEDKSNPLYWSYALSSTIALNEEQGLLPKGTYKPQDIASAPEVYRELLRLRDEAKANLAKLADATGQAATTAKLAQTNYDNFNYLDAARLSREALKGA